jgi:hypothetical protein
MNNISNVPSDEGFTPLTPQGLPGMEGIQSIQAAPRGISDVSVPPPMVNRPEITITSIEALPPSRNG